MEILSTVLVTVANTVYYALAGVLALVVVTACVAVVLPVYMLCWLCQLGEDAVNWVRNR